MTNGNNLKPFSKGYDPRRGVKPKGSKHLSTRIRELLEDPNLYDKLKVAGGPGASSTALEAIIAVAAKKALSDTPDSIKWAEWLAKYGYGNRDIEGYQPQELVIITRKHHAHEQMKDSENTQNNI